MSKSIKLKDNTYIDSTGVSHNRDTLKNKLNSIDTNIANRTLDIYQDTVGSDVKEMLRNKIDYGASKSTKTNETILLNGGWSTRNYGFGIYSKIGNTQHIVWFSTFGIYMCRKHNGTYNYYQVSLTTI